MKLTFKGYSRNSKNAFYSGAAVAIRIPLSAFPEKQAPQEFEVADGVFAPAKVKAVREPKRKLTAEERAALPKPTLAEKARKAQERADRLAKKAAEAEAAAGQPAEI